MQLARGFNDKNKQWVWFDICTENPTRQLYATRSRCEFSTIEGSFLYHNCPPGPEVIAKTNKYYRFVSSVN